MLGMMKDKNQDEKYIEMIHEYLNLNKRITQKEKKIDGYKQYFHNRNYYGGMDFYDPIQLGHKGFRVDSEVAHYVDRLATMNQSLKALKRRKQYFDTYIQNLNRDTQSGLQRDFKQYDERMFDTTLTNTHKKIIHEILEIEEAIGHEFHKDVLPEFNKDAVAVETNELTSDTLEDSFDAMINMLGVKEHANSR